MDINTDPYCCMVTDPVVALSSSTEWNFTMASGVRADYEYEALPLHPHISSSVSLHNAQTTLLLFLSHLSTTRLYIIVAPTKGGPHGG